MVIYRDTVTMDIGKEKGRITQVRNLTCIVATVLLTSTLCGTALSPALESILRQMFLAISASTLLLVSRSRLTSTTTTVSSAPESSVTTKG